MSSRRSWKPLVFFADLRSQVVRSHVVTASDTLPHSGGSRRLVCNEAVVMYELPVISFGEPPGAELNRRATHGATLCASLT